MKRKLSTILALILCLAMLPAPGFGEDAATFLETPEIEAAELIDAPEAEAADEAPSDEAVLDEADAEADAFVEAAVDVGDIVAEIESPSEDADEAPDAAEELELYEAMAPEEALEAVTAEDNPDEIPLMAPEIDATTGGGAALDNDALFEGFVARALPAKGGRRQRAPSYTAGERLSGPTAGLYNALRPKVAQVANGQQPSTVFSITAEELGLSGIYWTAADLGMESLIEDHTITLDALTAMFNHTGIDCSLVIHALLSDCPYDLYWFDKTVGYSWRYGCTIGSVDDEVAIGMGTLSLSLAVAQAYAVDEYTVDTTLPERVNQAVANINEVVARHAGKANYPKLAAYKADICSLVVYNHDAADNDDTPYGDPWQLVYVFDGDASTNVVCEGYSKAFKYLCDLSSFSGKVDCILVTGGMGTDALGGHMWNVVRMPDGKNYMVDVTNCDDGSAGAPDLLFMKGWAASYPENNQYSFDCYGTTLHYVYDQDTINTHSADRLILSQTDYDPNQADPTPDPKVTLTVAQGDAPFAKTYDGTAAYEGDALSLLTVTGLKAGDSADDVLLATAEFDGVGAGSRTVTVHLTVKAAQSEAYELAEDTLTGLEGEIAPKTLTLTGVSAPSKTYDGTTDVPGAYTEGLGLSGVLPGDEVGLSVTAAYESANASWNIPVTFACALTGGNAENYAIEPQTVVNGKIDKYVIQVWYEGDPPTKEYDAALTFNLNSVRDNIKRTPAVEGDDVHISGSVHFVDKSVGTGKPLIASFFLQGDQSVTGNYKLSYVNPFSTEGVITPKPLGVAFRGATLARVYDKTTDVYRGNDSAQAGSQPTLNDFRISGIIGSDYLSCELVSMAFDSDQAGPRLATFHFALHGNDKGNYTIGDCCANGQITPRPLTVTPGAADDAGGLTAQRKLYGDADPEAFLYSAPGLLASEDGDADALSGALSREPGEDAGSYAITLGTLANPNYDIALAAANPFVIEPRPVDDGEIAVDAIPDQAYDGAARTPPVTVRFWGEPLSAGADYALTYADNIHAGENAAAAVIEGAGNFTGTRREAFTILPADIADAALEPIADLTYTGAALEPDPALSFGGAALVRDRDYRIEYADNIQSGAATATITGDGDFTGSRAAGFLIAPKAIDADDVDLMPIPAQVLLDGAAEPPVALAYNGMALEAGRDYTLSYADNDRVGKAKAIVSGLGNYTGTREAEFEIIEALVDINAAELADMPDATFTGFPLEPDVTLTYHGAILVRGVDYRLTYAGNVQVGTATVTIEGIGAFEGSRETAFRIAAKRAVALKLTKSTSKSVKMGDCYQLKLSKKVKSYKSSKASVASVSKKGVVLAKAAGKAVITVTFTDNKTLKLTLKVIDPTMPTKLTLSVEADGAAGMPEGADLVLYTDGAGAARIAPVMAPSTAVSDVEWTWSGDPILSLTPSADGGCTATATGVAGSATITGTTARGGRTAALRVTALDSSDARTVTIHQGDAATALLDLDAPVFTATVTAFNGSETTDAAWASSNPAVAAIDAQTGEVALLRAGTATLTAAAPNGRSASLKLTVIDPLMPTGITVGGYKSKLPVRKTLKLTATPRWHERAPEERTFTVAWKSSNTGIATVGRTTGKVTAKKAGKVKITATVTATWNGRSVSKSVTKTITVTK